MKNIATVSMKATGKAAVLALAVMLSAAAASAGEVRCSEYNGVIEEHGPGGVRLMWETATL